MDVPDRIRPMYIPPPNPRMKSPISNPKSKINVQFTINESAILRPVPRHTEEMNISPPDFTIRPIGVVRSSLKDRASAPMQGYEGAPDAWIDIRAEFVKGLHLLEAGQDAVILTWLHQSRRDVLEVHPRGDRTNPLTGVFATRSPDRPNPVGLHRVKILSIEDGCRLEVRGLEAIDGTPVVDIKPVLERGSDA
jgi:tRNA-Thr(GGU) m(6)t(6)A37 methyltransferase TsaA